MTAITREELDRIDALQLAYIDALDSLDMRGWLETFSKVPEASYLCTTAENVHAALAIAFILDDCHARLEDRVTFVDKVWRGTYQAYQTRHMVQRVRCARAGPNQLQVKTNFIVCFSSEDSGIAELLTTGVYLDEIELNSKEAVFRSKQAIIDTSVLPHYIVYPL